MRPQTLESLSPTRRLYFFVSFLILSLAMFLRGNTFFLFLVPFIFPFISVFQFIIGRYADKRYPLCPLRIWIHLAPVLIFSAWFVWNFNFTRIPVLLFREHVMDPMPESVAQLKAFEADLDISWKAVMYFEISGKDFDGLLAARPFEKISKHDPRFDEILDQQNYFWKRDGWENFEDLDNPELYVYHETPYLHFYMLTDESHRQVFFQKKMLKTRRKTPGGDFFQPQATETAPSSPRPDSTRTVSPQ